MKNGNRVRGTLITIACFCLLPLQSATAQTLAPRSWDAKALMQELQQVRFGKARFVERRYLKILTAPLEATGTLIYVAPDRLEKNTLTPKPDRMLVEGGKLTIDQGDEHRTVTLRDYPEIGAFVESIRATLAGDLPTLEKLYDVSFQGTADDWQLSLQPKQRRMQALIKSIRIAGSGAMLRTIQTDEKDGDHSEMTMMADSP